MPILSQLDKDASKSRMFPLPNLKKERILNKSFINFSSYTYKQSSRKNVFESNPLNAPTRRFHRVSNNKNAIVPKRSKKAKIQMPVANNRIFGICSNFDKALKRRAPPIPLRRIGMKPMPIPLSKSNLRLRTIARPNWLIGQNNEMSLRQDNGGTMGNNENFYKKRKIDALERTGQGIVKRQPKPPGPNIFHD